MIRLTCERSEYWDNTVKRWFPCTYTHDFKDHFLKQLIFVTQNNGLNGIHCPKCHRWKLTVTKLKNDSGKEKDGQLNS